MSFSSLGLIDQITRTLETLAYTQPTPVASGPIVGVTPLGNRDAAPLRNSSTRERAQ